MKQFEKKERHELALYDIRFAYRHGNGKTEIILGIENGENIGYRDPEKIHQGYEVWPLWYEKKSAGKNRHDEKNRVNGKFDVLVKYIIHWFSPL
jgi:hypothetical protein